MYTREEAAEKIWGLELFESLRVENNEGCRFLIIKVPGGMVLETSGGVCFIAYELGIGESFSIKNTPPLKIV